MQYLEHLIILFIFLMAIKYLIQVFKPSESNTGCSKGCGNKCAVANLEKALENIDHL